MWLVVVKVEVFKVAAEVVVVLEMEVVGGVEEVVLEVDVEDRSVDVSDVDM